MTDSKVSLLVLKLRLAYFCMFCIYLCYKKLGVLERCHTVCFLISLIPSCLLIAMVNDSVTAVLLGQVEKTRHRYF